MRDVQQLLIDASRYLEYDTVLEMYSQLQHVIHHAKDYTPLEYEMACIDLENVLGEVRQVEQDSNLNRFNMKVGNMTEQEAESKMFELIIEISKELGLEKALYVADRVASTIDKKVGYARHHKLPEGPEHWYKY